MIYIFDLPVGTPLGQNENCFDHVQVKAFDVEHGLDITPKEGAVLFQPTGKLGGLQHGLLRVGDERDLLSHVEVAKLSEVTTEERLNTKRTWVPKNYCFQNPC